MLDLKFIKSKRSNTNRAGPLYSIAFIYHDINICHNVSGTQKMESIPTPWDTMLHFKSLAKVKIC